MVDYPLHALLDESLDVSNDPILALAIVVLRFMRLDVLDDYFLGALQQENIRGGLNLHGPPYSCDTTGDT